MWWFGKNDTAQNEKTGATPSSHLPGSHYDPTLIKHFREHHSELQKLVGIILEEIDKKAYASLGNRLAEFTDLFEQHNLQEIVRFYSVLSEQLEGEADKEYLLSMREEMRKIGHNVRHFLRQYLESGINAHNIGQFQQELHAILNVLGQRIKQEEESLFALYQPIKQQA